MRIYGFVKCLWQMKKRCHIQLLCDAARENGVEFLYDDIAIDNPAISLFLNSGFAEAYRTSEYIMLKKDL